jgi:Nucleotidyl transferase AbiEii toxin, Type IV TA system
VIDRPALIAWRSKAPWPDRVQVEQYLLLSRLMIEIARDEVLGGELAMRGGTCMHKLHLPSALRYSEDLDYVRSTRSGIKPYTQAIARIAEKVGLTVSSRQRSGQMVHVYLDGQPTEGIGRIRIKIEMNITETESFKPRKTVPHAVETSWWSGQARHHQQQQQNPTRGGATSNVESGATASGGTHSNRLDKTDLSRFSPQNDLSKVRGPIEYRGERLDLAC